MSGAEVTTFFLYSHNKLFETPFQSNSMILRKLRLKNIRSYTEGSIEFPMGSTLLCGDIGSGKSTIMYAIEFALFGALRGTLPAESLLRYGENFGFVVLQLDIDGKNIVITRTLKRTNTSIKQDVGSLEIDGTHYDLTPTELKARILNLLGYPADLVDKSKSLIFRYTVYTPQDLMKQILGDDAEFRLNTLRRIFSIDKYKRAQSNAKIAAKHLRDEQKELVGYTADLEEKRRVAQMMQAKGEAIAKKITQLDMDIQLTITLLERAKLQSQQSQERAEAITKKRAQQENVQDSLAKLDARVTQMQQHINTAREEIGVTQQKVDSLQTPITDIDAFANEIALLEQDIVKKEQQRMQAQKEFELHSRQKDEVVLSLKTMQTQHDQLLESLPPIDQVATPALTIDELNTKLSDARTKKEQLAVDTAKSQQRIDNATELTARITSLAQCPTCLQSVSDGHKHTISSTHEQTITLAKQMIETISQSRIAVENSIQTIQLHIVDAQRKEKEKIEIQARREKLGELSSRIEQSLAKQEEIDERIRGLQEANEAMASDDTAAEREQITSKKDMLRRAREKRLLEAGLIEKRKQLEQIEKDILREQETHQATQTLLTNLITELAGAREIIAARDNALLRVKEIEATRQAHAIELAKWRTEKTNIEESLITTRYEILQKEHSKDRLIRIGSLQQWLSEHFVNLMDVMERTMLLAVYHGFNDLFCKWFTLLVDDETISARLDANFTPHITQNGHDAIYSNLSGGERTAICLAFRLALNKVINDIVSTIRTKDVLLLDEPTDGFSDEQLDRVRDVLDALGLAQIIVVSHEVKIESFVNHVIRVEKSNHQSRILA